MRRKNCFRLPPSDAYAQPQAIAKFVSEKLGEVKKIELVADASKNATEYSENLTEGIKKMLGLSKEPTLVAIAGGGQVPRDAASHVFSSDPDLIIFCGYGPVAADFMTQLKERYANRKDLNAPRSCSRTAANTRD